MRFSLKRELLITLQYLLFSLCATTVALYEWDALWPNRYAESDDLIICYTTSDWVKNVVSNYYPRYLSIFLGLSSVRIVAVYIFSGRTRDLL